MSNYTFIKDYKDIADYRDSFNALTKQTYGFDFKDWYDNGHWGENYIPYSFADRKKVIANVSVNTMSFLCDGIRQNAVQLGTVMTHPDYRNQGFIRALMDKIFADYGQKCEYFYLFANDSVLNFYPKFGFCPVQEHQSIVPSSQGKRTIPKRKLNISNSKDKEILRNLAKEHVCISSKLSMRDNAPLILFYCESFMKDSLYYLPEEEILAVAEKENDMLCIVDIFSKASFSLHTVLDCFSTENSQPIFFGFTPDLPDDIEAKCIPYKSNLFMRPVKGDFKSAMFPILSHA